MIRSITSYMTWFYICLFQMETSRRTYEEATHRLMTFLEQVTSVLQGSGPVQRKLMESTRAEISRVARKAKLQQASQQRLSFDPSHHSVISRTESMPGTKITTERCNSTYSVSDKKITPPLILMVEWTFYFETEEAHDSNVKKSLLIPALVYSRQPSSMT